MEKAGATIDELNTVRKHLSRIKGGRLARACRAGTLVSLIISDVLGDPLEVIASGPTVPDTTTAREALAVLDQFHARESGIAATVFHCLQAQAAAHQSTVPGVSRRVANYVIGNNAVAVDAAGHEAERRGYSHAMIAARQLEGEAAAVGQHLHELSAGVEHLDPGVAGVRQQQGQLHAVAICQGRLPVRFAQAGVGSRKTQ